MNIGFYAGSFDPFTVGHLYIVKEASKIFDKVIVAIGVNAQKQRRFDKEEMKIAIEKLLKCEKIKNFEVIVFEGSSAEYAKKYGAEFLIRGIRNTLDYEFEENLAFINEEIFGMQTVFFRPGKYKMVSSSLVMELLKLNKDVSQYVPQYVIDIIKNNN